MFSWSSWPMRRRGYFPTSSLGWSCRSSCRLLSGSRRDSANREGRQGFTIMSRARSHDAVQIWVYVVPVLPSSSPSYTLQSSVLRVMIVSSRLCPSCRNSSVPLPPVGPRTLLRLGFSLPRRRLCVRFGARPPRPSRSLHFFEVSLRIALSSSSHGDFGSRGQSSSLPI